MIVNYKQTGLFLAIAGLAIINGGCSPKVVTRDAPVTVKVPVRVPCAAIRPEKPEPMPDASHWAEMDVRMKAAALGAYAIRLRDYSEALDAATSGCL